jgi:exodeoxyribonuclease V alpha subunit
MGDRDQLPSVEAGAVLAGILPDAPLAAAKAGNIGFVVLSKNYRSQPQVQQIAAAVNRGDVSIVDSLPRADSIAQALENDGVVIIESDQNDKRPAKVLAEWAKYSFAAEGPGSLAALLRELSRLDAHQPAARDLAAAALRQLERNRILAVTRQGPLGSAAINRHLIEVVFRDDRAIAASRAAAFAGLPVMATSNDYARGIFNGDLGLYARDLRGNLLLWIDIAGGVGCFAGDAIAGLEPAYAATVHKGQGSECENLLLILPSDANHRLLTRQIIYTAITRAKRRVIIYGNPDALRTAINRPIRRDSGELWG